MPIKIINPRKVNVQKRITVGWLVIAVFIAFYLNFSGIWWGMPNETKKFDVLTGAVPVENETVESVMKIIRHEKPFRQAQSVSSKAVSCLYSSVIFVMYPSQKQREYLSLTKTTFLCRMVSAVINTSAVLVLYFTGRILLSNNAGIVSSIFLLAFPLVPLSSKFVNEFPLLCLITITCLLFLSLYHKKNNTVFYYVSCLLIAPAVILSYSGIALAVPVIVLRVLKQIKNFRSLAELLLPLFITVISALFIVPEMTSTVKNLEAVARLNLSYIYHFSLTPVIFFIFLYLLFRAIADRKETDIILLGASVPFFILSLFSMDNNFLLLIPGLPGVALMTAKFSLTDFAFLKFLPDKLSRGFKIFLLVFGWLFALNVCIQANGSLAKSDVYMTALEWMGKNISEECSIGVSENTGFAGAYLKNHNFVYDIGKARPDYLLSKWKQSGPSGYRQLLRFTNCPGVFYRIFPDSTAFPGFLSAVFPTYIIYERM